MVGLKFLHDLIDIVQSVRFEVSQKNVQFLKRPLRIY